jgi:hypothetical protein
VLRLKEVFPAVGAQKNLAHEPEWNGQREEQNVDRSQQLE